MIYSTACFGLTVLTDTTERAPTFSLAPFENRYASSDSPSLCYLRVPGAPSVDAAWRMLLGRAPRCLEWETCRAFTGRKWLDGYSLATAPAADAALIEVDHADDGIRFEPWELGQGRSREVVARSGKQRVYLDFLRQIESQVASRGRVMHYWADILLERPEFIAEAPRRAVPIIWGYDVDHPFAEQCAVLAGSELAFQVAPGDATWKCFSGRLETTLRNQQAAAREGLRQGRLETRARRPDRTFPQRLAAQKSSRRTA